MSNFTTNSSSSDDRAEVDSQIAKELLFGASDNQDQIELFVPDDTPGDLSVKDDVSSMEFPIFSLSKRIDTSVRIYNRNGKHIRIIPSALGAATVFDKDILIYCISTLIKAKDDGVKTSRKIKIDVTKFLKSTKRSTGGSGYESVLDMCRRLKGTTIETNIKSTDEEKVKGFGLLEDYEINRSTKNGKGILDVTLTISDWLYRSVIGTEILTLDPAYFDLSQSVERRLYEIARKHCGQQAWFVIGIELLKDKVGSAQQLKFFKTELKKLIRENQLPVYRIAMDTVTKPHKIVFFTRNNAKLIEEANKQGKIEWINMLLQQTLPLNKP